jgi:hypothetical protein
MACVPDGQGSIPSKGKIILFSALGPPNLLSNKIKVGMVVPA